MADNYTRGSETFRSVDNAGIEMPGTVVGPHMPTVVSGAQYNQTVTSSVFTLTVPSGATFALVTISTNDVNYTEDGSSPSATNGLRLPAGFVGELALPAPLKFFRVSADAVLNVSYRKYV